MNIKEIIDSSSNFADLLKFIYGEKKRKNPSYSVRAFSNFLDVTHAYLQQIINGEKSPSEKFILQVMKKLEIDEKYTQLFLDLASKKTIRGMPLIESDKAKTIKSSLDLAIYSLLSLKKKPVSISWLQETLEVDEKNIMSTLQSLEVIGMIEITDGKAVLLGDEKLFKIPHQEGSLETDLLLSIREDFSTPWFRDKIEYMYLPGNYEDINYIRRFISSSLMEMANSVMDEQEEANELFQIACFIRPIIHGKKVKES